MPLSDRISEFMRFQEARLHRVRRMDGTQIIEKLRSRLVDTFSYRRIVRRLAYYLNAYSIGLHPDDYAERAEAGPQNIQPKLERVRHGGPFEPYSVSVVNRAAVRLLGNEKRILEIGCGTGMFSFLAAHEPHRAITASELDQETLAWAIQNRSRPNISYCGRELADFEVDEFETVVAVELIEHIADFSRFLEQLSRVAPLAIVTTPNKSRSPFDSIANTPEYSEHVREWTAGEFYWVLRAFYGDVQMYTIPGFESEVERLKHDEDAMPPIARCSVLEQSEPLLAVCASPMRNRNLD